MNIEYVIVIDVAAAPQGLQEAVMHDVAAIPEGWVVTSKEHREDGRELWVTVRGESSPQPPVPLHPSTRVLAVATE
jgi:hypothetical protein